MRKRYVTKRLNVYDSCLCHVLTLKSRITFNPLSPNIKLRILLLCFDTFLTEEGGEAVKISIEFDWSDLVLNSHDLTN